MLKTRTSGLLIVAVLLLAGCSSGPQRLGFLHTSYRTRYLITDPEFKKLQFYVSTEILVQGQSFRTGHPGSGTQVIVVRKGTPGVVTEVGSYWLRVSFEKGGPGVFFVTDPSKPEDRYWLGTEVQGRQGFSKVRDLSEKVLMHLGTSYAVVYGDDAYLLVNASDLDKIIKSRRHIGGRSVTK
jgi:hypothetical protein